jgi:hypothetical protein
MPRFHHLWVVAAELEVRNPQPERRRDPDDDASCAGRIFQALAAYASDDSSPYPAQVVREDDRWLEITFPVWAPTRFAALGAGATVLAEVCARARVETGVVRLAAGESADELQAYREQVHGMEEVAS